MADDLKDAAQESADGQTRRVSPRRDKHANAGTAVPPAIVRGAVLHKFTVIDISILP